MLFASHAGPRRLRRKAHQQNKTKQTCCSATMARHWKTSVWLRLDSVAKLFCSKKKICEFNVPMWAVIWDVKFVKLKKNQSWQTSVLRKSTMKESTPTFCVRLRVDLPGHGKLVYCQPCVLLLPVPRISPSAILVADLAQTLLPVSSDVGMHLVNSKTYLVHSGGIDQPRPLQTVCR